MTGGVGLDQTIAVKQFVQSYRSCALVMEGLKNLLPLATSRIAENKDVGGRLFFEKTDHAHRVHTLDILIVAVRRRNKSP